ncbi:MAG: hypothetical protein DRN95_03065 [Candidatus Hydrothermarchaeota archaeon]|nr:MAG: hypothetical protein DRN95_03065 [Candidatus Hydrothermarchaeota archaeon]
MRGRISGSEGPRASPTFSEGGSAFPSSFPEKGDDTRGARIYPLAKLRARRIPNMLLFALS